MPYILYLKQKSNHKKVLGLFQQESQARLYSDMWNLGGQFPHGSLSIEHIEFKDSCPELVEYILSKK